MEDLLTPWQPLPLERAAAAEAELGRELAATHPLYGLVSRALAERSDCDDVLFETIDGNQSIFAVFHLTWSGHEDPNAGWPSATLFDSLDTWRRDCMLPDHEDWIA
jgi:hypothetical protein